MVLNVHRNHCIRLIRDRKTGLVGRGVGVGGGERLDREGDYIPIATLSPPE